MTEMNQTQQKVIDRLRDELMYQHNDKYDFQKDNPHEIKKEKVYMIDGWNRASYTITIGMVGDEGTLGSVFARDRRSFIIGPRGGIELSNAKTKSHSKGFWNAIHALTW